MFRDCKNFPESFAVHSNCPQTPDASFFLHEFSFRGEFLWEVEFLYHPGTYEGSRVQDFRDHRTNTLPWSRPGDSETAEHNSLHPPRPYNFLLFLFLLALLPEAIASFYRKGVGREKTRQESTGPKCVLISTSPICNNFTCNPTITKHRNRWARHHSEPSFPLL